MFNKVMQRLLGNNTERELKKMRPIVQQINSLEPQMSALSDTSLQEKTFEFKKRLAEGGILYNKEKTILLQYPAGKKGASFVIPSSITEIGDYAFGGNESLTETTIHQQIKKIGAFAFVL